jgi:hypothetical protein
MIMTVTVMDNLGSFDQGTSVKVWRKKQEHYQQSDA